MAALGKYVPRYRWCLSILTVLVILPISGVAQISRSSASSDTLRLSLKKAVELAFRQNELLKSNLYQVKADRELEKTDFDPGNTSLSYNHEEFSDNTSGKKSFQVSQSIPFPLQSIRKKHFLQQQTDVSSRQLDVTQNYLRLQVKQAWFQLVYAEKKAALLAKLNQTYNHLSRVAGLRYKTGETTLLNKVTAESRQQEIANQLRQADADIDIAGQELQKWLNTSSPVVPDTSGDFQYHSDLPINGLSFSGNPQLDLARSKIIARKAGVAFQQSQYFPDLDLAFGLQTIAGQSGFYAFTIGVQFPLWFEPVKARVNAEKIQVRKAKAEYNFKKTRLSRNIQKAAATVKKNQSNVSFYRQKALKQAKELARIAKQSYQAGEIDYTEYLIDIKQASQIRMDYLDAVNQYNQARIHLEYLVGN